MWMHFTVSDYNHKYNVYHTNMNVILHQYTLSYMYNTDISYNY